MHRRTLGLGILLALLALGPTGCEVPGVGPDREARGVAVRMSRGSSSAGGSVAPSRGPAEGDALPAARSAREAADSVNLAIDEVQVLRVRTDSAAGDSTDGSWISLDVQSDGDDGGSVVVDLLALPTGGAAVTVARDQLTEGTYRNVRLFFERAWVRLDTAVTLGDAPEGQGGRTFEAGAHDLFVASGEQTGVKVPTAEFTVDGDGAVVDVLADTDASIRTLRATGRGLLMTPVLTARTGETP